MARIRKLLPYLAVGGILVTLYITVFSVTPRAEELEYEGHRESGRFLRDPGGKEQQSYKEKEVDRVPERTDKEDLTLDMKLKLREAENRNNRRLENIQTVCKKYNLGMFKQNQDSPVIPHPPVPQYGVFYFDRVHNWSLCPIYKAGSSTWLYNMCLLGGIPEDVIDNSGKQLSVLARTIYPELEPADAEQLLQTTTKVLTVRHPFERILSAYRDKLENTNYGQEHGTLHYYKAYGSKIVKKYRPGGNDTKTWDILQPTQYSWNPQHPKPEGIEPTFKEFVRYLTNTNIVHYSDDHWIPYYLFCTPCLLNYDIVTKVETLELDQIYVIRALRLQDKIKPRWRHKTQFTQDNDEIDQNEPSYFSKIYFSQLTRDEMDNLYEKYKIDFELFDYDYGNYLDYAIDSI